MEELQNALHSLADRVRETDAKLAALTAFLDRLEDCAECFSSDELGATRARIDALAKERTQMCDQLRQKVDVYEHKCVELFSTLEARKAIVDEHGVACMQGAPELLGVFAQQHATLSAELEAARSFLLTQD